jgi:hypothetical protein
MIRIHIQIRIKVLTLIQIRIRIRITVMLIHNTGVMFKELPVPLYIRDAWQSTVDGPESRLPLDPVPGVNHKHRPRALPLGCDGTTHFCF